MASKQCSQWHYHLMKPVVLYQSMLLADLPSMMKDNPNDVVITKLKQDIVIYNATEDSLIII